MMCVRCDGLMVVDRFDDFRDDTGEFNFKAWRCLTCGEIIDSVIISNRQKHVPPLSNRNRKIMAYH